MFSSNNKVAHHAKRVVAHVKKHQHTYLFFGGLAGGVFLVTKIIMLFATSYMFYNISHDVSFAEDVVIEETTTVEEPVVETTTVEEPVVETTTVEEPVTDTTTVEEPVTDTTTVEEPVVDTTIEEEPVVDTTIEEEPVTDTTIEEEPVVDTTIEEEPVTDTTTEEELVTDTTTVEEPVTDTTTVEEYGFEETASVTCDYLDFTANITGLLYSGIINLSWTLSPDCFDEMVDIQLYDHNEEWITLASVSGDLIEYNFDTTLLGSGFYLQTGLNFSGEVEILNPGIYSGTAMDSWTGYYIRWLLQPDTILHQTQEFTIDNKKPEILNISLVSSGVSSGVVGVGKPLTIAFDSSELLTGVIVSVASGQVNVASGSTGTHYIYNYTIPSSLELGAIPYTISYQDFAGNTGYTTGLSQLVYDNIYPQITGFVLSGYDFSFVTSELTTANTFVIIKNTTNGWAFTMTGVATGHMFSLPTLGLNTDYDMGIVVKDIAGNESKAALALKRNNSGDIQYNLLATLYGEILTTYGSGTTFLSNTGSLQSLTGVEEDSILKEFKIEIDKFTQCKNDIDYTKVKIQIKGSEIELNIPAFQRSEIKKLVNGFVLYILKSLEESPLSEIELQDIAQKFDSFAVILKLIKEDNNECKQNLSNYHLEQFKQSLDTYGIEI